MSVPYLLRIGLFIGLVIVLPGSSWASDGSLQEKLGGKIDIVVASDGSGDHLTVQAGINAVPNNSSQRTVLFIKKGTYREKITVPSAKINLTLVGEDVDSTIIVYDDYADKVPGMGTFETPTFEIQARDFRAMNLTFMNDARPGGTGSGQNVAVASYGERNVFLHCRFISWQDTYYTGADGRHYFKDCFIEGAVDYIFGHTTSIFDSCQIHTPRSGGYITAASTKENYGFGYVFFNCRLTAPPGISGVYLGRPWKTYAQTVFFECIEYENISPLGWKTWDGRENTCFYAEYKCTGPGSGTGYRVDWSHQLSEAQAAAYTMENIFSKATSTDFSGDWNPAVESDSVYIILRGHTTLFMDSINLNADIASLKLNGEDLPDWDPSTHTYFIELPEDITDVPLIEATAVNPLSSVEIEYPDDLPGFAEVTILANDRASHSSYSIYLSIDGASGNALLDSIKVGGIPVADFHPDSLHYEVVLPQGTSPYYPVNAYPQAPDTRASVTKPASLPGTINIVVTAVDGTARTYAVDASISTGVETISGAGTRPVFRNPSGPRLSFSLHGTGTPGPMRLKVFDLKGSLLLERNWDAWSPGDYHVTLGANARGWCVYQLTVGPWIYSGKLYIEPISAGYF